MDTVIRLIFAPIQPFIGHPERALFAAVGFAMLLAIAVIRTSAFQWRQLVIVATAIAWVLFSVAESKAVAAGWNIRVDLMLTAPPLLVLSLASILIAFRRPESSALDDSQAVSSVD